MREGGREGERKGGKEGGREGGKGNQKERSGSKGLRACKRQVRRKWGKEEGKWVNVVESKGEVKRGM